MIIRSVVHSIEFLQGQDGYVISHEIFIYVIDASPIVIIMLAFLVLNPGRLVRDCVRSQAGWESRRKRQTSELAA